MNLLKLRYFKVIAKHENVSEAAKELNVSQPAISKLLKDLENEIGYELFTRKKKRLYLNNNGRILLHYVDEIFRSIDNANQELADYNERKSYPIFLSLLAISDIIVPIIEKFNNEKGYTEFIINQSASSRDADKHDIMIFSSEKKSLEENTISVLVEPISLVVPLSHPLSKRESVSLTELRNEEFIGLARTKPLRQMTDDYCQRVGFKPKVLWETDSPQIAREMLGIGRGIAFIPLKSWKLYHPYKVKQLRIEEDFFIRYINISWPKNNYMSKSVKEFRDFVIDYLEKL